MTIAVFILAGLFAAVYAVMALAELTPPVKVPTYSAASAACLAIAAAVAVLAP